MCQDAEVQDSASGGHAFGLKTVNIHYILNPIKLKTELATQKKKKHPVTTEMFYSVAKNVPCHEDLWVDACLRSSWNAFSTEYQKMYVKSPGSQQAYGVLMYPLSFC
jgi:hypothetical protein